MVVPPSDHSSRLRLSVVKEKRPPLVSYLPERVSKGSDNISYIYSATGTKLAMLNGTAVDNYYAGTCVYKGDRTLDYALHPEGVVRATEEGLSHEYFLRDHLGSTRVVFSSTGAVLQTTDYYAFGMAHAPLLISNANGYLYNGKEQQDATLGGVRFDWYDYGARFYDPVIGRFPVMDNYSEKYVNMSPYQYAANNPLLYIDINGDSIATVFLDEKGNRLSSIPDVVQQMFNKEWGIKVGYNAETGMMYYDGDVETDLKVSESARETVLGGGCTAVRLFLKAPLVGGCRI